MAASQGPNSPGAVGSASYGANNWFTAASAKASDDVYAKASGASGTFTSWYLRASSFGFGIPAEATVTGVLAEIERKCTRSAASVGTIDAVVRLHSAGTVSGNNKAVANLWPTTEGYTGYGASGDAWGLPLTPAYVNAASFGFSLAVRLQTTATTRTVTAQVDHMRMTVWYEVSGVRLSCQRMAVGVGR